MYSLLIHLLLGLAGTVWATTRHVPVEYPTIQSALDSLSEGDTVLVDLATYEEALVAPSLFFVLRGNVIADTGEYPRPVIDPSSLSNPTGRTCLRQDSGGVIIEDMVFRNRFPMYPHTGDTIGGIRHPHGEVTLRRCVFDSTFHALWAYWADVTASDCIFRHQSGWTIRSLESVVATDCEFQSNAVLWAQLQSGSHSRIERCSFSGNYDGQSILICNGDDIQVRECIFGPGVATAGERFYWNASNSIFEDNLIENWSAWQGIFSASVDGLGALHIRHNVMRNCRVPDGHPELGLYGFRLEMLPNCDSCYIAFDSNEVVDCSSGFWGAPGLYAQGGDIRARFNRFTQISPVAVGNGGSLLVLRDNLIYGNSMGLQSEDSLVTDARLNWWGDSTGPFCPQNPGGMGDLITGNVLFDPWHTDTSFFPNVVSPERQSSVPEELALSVYPNPFNPVATFRFGLVQDGRVRLDVYNITGQKVETLMDEEFTRGYHTVEFNAADLPTGIYFARIEAGRFVKTEKMVLLK